MARWISAELRQTIANRAKLLCEYCLIVESDTFYGCEVDHIINLKHGGSSEPENLAYACALCNRAKGSDVGFSFYVWRIHAVFQSAHRPMGRTLSSEGASLQPLTTIGEVTARILGFNDSARLHEREEMIRFGKYPSEEALALLAG